MEGREFLINAGLERHAVFERVRADSAEEVMSPMASSVAGPDLGPQTTLTFMHTLVYHDIGTNTMVAESREIVEGV